MSWTLPPTPLKKKKYVTITLSEVQYRRMVELMPYLGARSRCDVIRAAVDYAYAHPDVVMAYLANGWERGDGPDRAASKATRRRRSLSS